MSEPAPVQWRSGGGGEGGGEILCSKDWLCKKHNHVGVE